MKFQRGARIVSGTMQALQGYGSLHQDLHWEMRGKVRLCKKALRGDPLCGTVKAMSKLQQRPDHNGV